MRVWCNGEGFASPKLKLAHVCKLNWGREGKGFVFGGASSREDWAGPWVLKWGKGKEGFVGYVQGAYSPGSPGNPRKVLEIDQVPKKVLESPGNRLKSPGKSWKSTI